MQRRALSVHSVYLKAPLGSDADLQYSLLPNLLFRAQSAIIVYLKTLFGDDAYPAALKPFDSERLALSEPQASKKRKKKHLGLPESGSVSEAHLEHWIWASPRFWEYAWGIK